MSVNLCGYDVRDIEWVAAFDVSENKIGKDLSDAIFQPPNITRKFFDLPKLGVVVEKGPILDGVANHMRPIFKPYSGKEPTVEDVAEKIRESGAHIVINFLPVGSKRATFFYAEAAKIAGAAFINSIPIFVASDPTGTWPKKYEEAGLPLVGDDVKGQLGATILHRTLVALMHKRGVVVEETYQLNIGGNTDFLNMTVEERLESKRISKTKAVTSVLPYGDNLIDGGRIRIGPSDYVPFLGNTKIAYIYIRGTSFAGFPVIVEAKLRVDDKSMFAGAMIDVIRGTKIALDRGIRGVVPSISAYFFKHPPVQAPDDDIARKWFIEFVEGKRNK